MKEMCIYYKKVCLNKVVITDQGEKICNLTEFGYSQTLLKKIESI